MVSIRDVAARAGVAISTVSKVVNHYPNVSEETRNKVNKAIDELDFVPNTIAAALSSKRSGRIALLINLHAQTQAIDEIGMQYMAGAIHQAQKDNLDLVTVFFTMIQEMSMEELTRYFLSQNIAGVIICGLSKDDLVLQALIKARKFNIVVIDAPIVNSMTSSVWINHSKAQYEIAERTITQNNAKRILYIAGKTNGYVTEERLCGMRKLVEDKDLSMLIRFGNFSELEARKLTFQYAQNKDIIVCASDLMAIGAMKALIEMDIFRPVCGFDGITLMGYVGKQMNTVKQDFFRISEEAVKELQQLMNGNQGRNRVLDYEIVQMQYLDIIC